jgi:hypothetical protein
MGRHVNSDEGGQVIITHAMRENEEHSQSTAQSRREGREGIQIQ